MTFSFKSERFQELCEYALQKAKSLGATDSTAEFSESVGQSINVRLGEVETIEQTRDRGFEMTVFVGKRKGDASSSDFNKEAIDAVIEKAVDIAKYTAEDSYAGLPDPTTYCKRPRSDLEIHHPWKLSTAKAIEKALEAEQAALDYSSKIRNSDGASVSTEQSHFYMASSNGFAGGFPSSSHHISVSAIAQEKKSKNSPMYRDFWYSSNVNPKKLAKPKSIGNKAGERATARLGARKISTRQCPVLFEPRMAASLLGHYVRALYGTALYRENSYLLDSMGKKVWASHLSVKDDPFVPGGAGTSPFDEEGCKVKARTVVKKGEVNGYFLSTYSARKLNLESTGNCGGTHNLIVSSTKATPGGLSGMLALMGTGLLVTETMGQGVNPVTGDYSKGAFGYWVENGVIVHPVEEITIASNLKDMFANVVAVGDDFDWVSNKWISSMLIETMTVAGN